MREPGMGEPDNTPADNREIAPRRRFRWQFSIRSLLLVTLLVAVGCAWWVWPEWAEQFEANGALRISMQIRRDTEGVEHRHGTWIVYDGNGQERAKGAWLDPLVSGYWTYHDGQGRKLLEGECRGGQKLGPWMAWHDEEHKKSETNYRNGFPQGASSTWWPNGHLRSQGGYHVGRRSGVWSFYDERGRLRSRGEFVAGQEEGPWQVLDEQGQPAATRRYVAGRPVADVPDQLAAYTEATRTAPVVQAREALWALQSLGAPAEMLAAGLQHADAEVRQRSARLLVGNSPANAEQVPALAAALDDPHAGVRQAVAAALGSLGPAAAEALPKLRQLAVESGTRMDFAQFPVRDIERALLTVTPEDLTQWRYFLESLQRNKRVLLTQPLNYQWESWMSHADAIPALGRLTEDRSVIIATNAVLALGEFRWQGEQVLPHLLQALDDPRLEVRQAACMALGRLGTEALSAYTRVANLVHTDPEIPVREAAERTLHELKRLPSAPWRYYGGFSGSGPGGGWGPGFF